MKNAEIEIVYTVHYQQKGDTDWYAFTNIRYVNTAHGNHETTDLAEALAAANALMAGELQTSNLPQCRANVTATCVIERVIIGGTVATYGEPAES